MRKWGKRMTVDQHANAIGEVAVIMFVTLMLTVLLSFHCLPNPTVPKLWLQPQPRVLATQAQHHGRFGCRRYYLYPVGIFSVVVWIFSGSQHSLWQGAVDQY